MTGSFGRATKGNVLVVDDTSANLRLLSGMLKDEGYVVRPVPSGKLALRAAESSPPDLILLDINMPEMDGYQVCQRLKADDGLRDIPVIFISALSETMDKVKAFSVGGVDYITKPFQFEEVQARVQTHLALRQKERQLQESYDELRRLEEVRDSLVHMIVHDLRSPLTGMYGYLELFQMLEAENLTENGTKYLQQIADSTDTLIEMVSSLLDVNKMESGEMQLNPESCDLRVLVGEVLEKLGGLKGGRELSLEPLDSPATLVCDPELVRRTVQNLVGNSLKFTPADGSVRVRVEPTGGKVRVSVIDTGPGIPPEYQAKIFEKFGQVELREQRQKHSTGLGLAFCKLAVETHGGEIGVDSEVGKGSTFWFELPTSGPVPEEGES